MVYNLGMLQSSPFRSRSGGFTLVELLIVVAIIGVLSTIGVPTFRRMIQKSRQAEAKLMLGAIYRVEAAFQAEYQVYGNNLGFMGFGIEGETSLATTYVGHPGRYVLGFPELASCSASSPAPNPMPANLSPAYDDPGTWFSVWYPESALIFTWPCLLGAVPSNGSSFLATANGIVDTSVDPAAPPAQALDQWSIDSSRLLRNVQSGVR